jgi:hypothetical protein
MNQTKRRRLLYGMVTAEALSLLLIGPALAVDTTTVTVTAGGLSITNPLGADFAGKTITGVAQTTTADLQPYIVSDLRGSGAGWHVTAVASTFTSAAGSLAVGSLVSEPRSVASVTLFGDPTDMESKVLDNGAVTIASAAADGMGIFLFSDNTLTLSLPADVKAGAYSSTMTISVVTAP